MTGARCDGLNNAAAVSIDFFIMEFALSSDLYALVFIPLMIFLARMCDVTIGTIRILTLSKGYKLITVVLGFVELMIWLLAIGQLFQNLNNMLYYVAYAGGFAAGNYIGMTIEERMALGSAVIRVITKTEADELFRYLTKHNHGFTQIEAEGAKGAVHVIYLIVERKNIEHMIRVINRFHPKAFYTIEDVRAVKEGIFARNVRGKRLLFARGTRKGK